MKAPSCRPTTSPPNRKPDRPASPEPSKRPKHPSPSFRGVYLPLARLPVGQVADRQAQADFAQNDNRLKTELAQKADSSAVRPRNDIPLLSGGDAGGLTGLRQGFSR